VRHLCDFLDFPEKLANALATRKRLRHLISRFVEPSGPGRLSGRPPSIATIRTAVETPLPLRFGRPPNRHVPAAVRQTYARFRGLLTPESVALTSHLLEFHLAPGLFQLGLALLRLVLAHTFLNATATARH